MTLAPEIIETDHRLETAADKASGKLAEHRWRWTLDETNPDRVSFTEYARATGRTVPAISAMANGFKDNLKSGRPLQEAIQLQSVKQADRQIVEAVAKATGTSVVNTRQHHRDDIDRVRNTVAEYREKEDVTPERETEIVDRAAQMINAERKARRTEQDIRKRSTPLQVLVVEGDLARAREHLAKALVDADALDNLDEDFLSMLRDTIDRVVALAKLVQLKLVGSTEVDWDAELAKIGT